MLTATGTVDENGTPDGFSVDIVDVQTGEVVASVPRAAQSPSGIGIISVINDSVIDASGNIYLGLATDSLDNNGRIVIFHPDEQEPESIDIPGVPLAFSIDPSGTRVLAYVYSNGFIGVIDVNNFNAGPIGAPRALSDIGEGELAAAGVLIGDDGTVYRLNLAELGTPNSITVVTSSGVETEVNLDGYGTSLAGSADGKHLYATVVRTDVQADTRTVSLVNLKTGESMDLGESPSTGTEVFLTRAAVSPDGTRVLVTDVLHNTVLAVDIATGEVVAVVPVGVAPVDVEFSAGGQYAYVAGLPSYNSANPQAVRVIAFADSQPEVPIDVDVIGLADLQNLVEAGTSR